MKKSYLYVHAGTLQQFQEYERQQVDGVECIQILDGETLRGRTQGLVVRIGTHYEKWNAQEIEESIAIHEDLWSKSSSSSPQDDEQGNLDYGIE
jgi:hypothetical protein